MARIELKYGRRSVELEIPASKLVPTRLPPRPPPVANRAEALRAVLETPLDFPPLARALTPHDRVVIVVDEQLDCLPELLTPILEVLTGVGVTSEQVAFLVAPRSTTKAGTDWCARLPGLYGSIAVEVHAPEKREQMSYLASTKAGRRVYLNRTLVDADQVIVVSRASYDPVVGYGGGLADLFPALSDQETRDVFDARPREEAPGGPVWNTLRESEEVGWLLGTPFVVQVVQGPEETVLHVLAGQAEAVSVEARRLQDQVWRMAVAHAADLAITAIAGDGTRQTLADAARAFAAAARVVRTGGRIALLTELGPEPGPAGELLRRAEHAVQALSESRRRHSPDSVAIWQWATAAEQAHLYLLSRLPPELADEIFVTPLDIAEQVNRLIDQAESCVVLPEGHRLMPVLDQPGVERRAAL